MSVSTETKQNDEQSTLSENDIPYWEKIKN
jgi:hypothetical protein